MTTDDRVGTLHYEFPYYEDMIQPKGALTIDRESHACFYYAMLAMKARIKAGPIETQQIQYKVGEEIPLWREPRDAEIAKSVALIYGLESPEQFLKFKREAWLQMIAVGVPPGEIAPEIFDVTPKGITLQ